MKTKIIKINPDKIDESKIEEVARILKNKGIVAFPTETVYGLGADALNYEAVEKIFKAKNRPADNPLIVHISEKKDIYKLTKEVPENAAKLMEEFWPGPLTIILKKSEIVPSNITCNLDTVAIRMPENKIARAIIEKFGPIAAPSANLSGKPSPTSAKHVIEDLNGKIDAIVDGDESNIGIESTVINLSSQPEILRPGKITKEEIEKIIGKLNSTKTKEIISPGMKYKHYAPKAEMILTKKLEEEIEKNKDKKIGIMTFNKEIKKQNSFYLGNDLEIAASKIYSTLRKFDEIEVEVIICEAIDENGIGVAIMNRLKKAASKII